MSDKKQPDPSIRARLTWHCYGCGEFQLPNTMTEDEIKKNPITTCPTCQHPANMVEYLDHMYGYSTTEQPWWGRRVNGRLCTRCNNADRKFHVEEHRLICAACGRCAPIQ